MLANRRLARHICEAGFGEIRRQLSDKTTWNGAKLIIADRWYPSSKTCSGCGATKAKLPLRVADLHLRALRPQPRPGPQRRTQPRPARHPHHGYRSGRRPDQKTTLVVAGGCEASTPHRITGQDGDRSPVTASCE
jgi:putative transposase